MGSYYDFTSTDWNASVSNLFAVLFWPLMIFCIILLAVAIICIIATWKIYAKAGKPGWAAIIPIYNFVVLFEIVGLPVWLIILYIIPFVNYAAVPVISIIAAVKLAKCFGKDIAFALGLIFLPFIFYPILAFGKSTYQGPDNDTTQKPQSNPAQSL